MKNREPNFNNRNCLECGNDLNECACENKIASGVEVMPEIKIPGTLGAAMDAFETEEERKATNRRLIEELDSDPHAPLLEAARLMYRALIEVRHIADFQTMIELRSMRDRIGEAIDDFEAVPDESDEVTS